MLGLMQDRPLLISQIIDFAGSVLSRRRDRDAARSRGRSIATATGTRAKRAKQLAEALQGLGIKLGDRVGTIAWNTYRHFELYFGISGIGAVLHTINPRLAPEHVAYIANHAEDKVDLRRPQPAADRRGRVAASQDGEACRGHDRPRPHAGLVQDPQPAVLRGADRGQAGHARSGPTSTRRRRRRSATPRARRAIPRACSTRTARR